MAKKLVCAALGMILLTIPAWGADLESPTLDRVRIEIAAWVDSATAALTRGIPLIPRSTTGDERERVMPGQLSPSSGCPYCSLNGDNGKAVHGALDGCPACRNATQACPHWKNKGWLVETP